jgi:hypothetical protein
MIARIGRLKGEQLRKLKGVFKRKIVIQKGECQKNTLEILFKGIARNVRI